MGLGKKRATEKKIKQMERKRDIIGLNKALADSNEKERWRATFSIGYLAIKGVCDKSSIVPLNNALLDYIEFSHVELSDCLIARQAKNAGAKTLYTFEGEKKLGALPVVTTLRKKADAI